MADITATSDADLRRVQTKFRDMGDGTMARVIFAAVRGSTVGDVTVTSDQDIRRLPLRMRDMGDGTFAEVVAVEGLPDGDGISQSDANGGVQTVPSTVVSGSTVSVMQGQMPAHVRVLGVATLAALTFQLPPNEDGLLGRVRRFSTRRTISDLVVLPAVGGNVWGAPEVMAPNESFSLQEVEINGWQFI